MEKNPNRRLLIYLYCCPTVILYHIINTHAMVAASVLNRINGYYTPKFIYGMYIHVIDKEPSSYYKQCSQKVDHTGASGMCRSGGPDSLPGRG